MRPAAFPRVLAAGCTHFADKFFLTCAYDRGDLSRVYPIARGAAPMIVALAGGYRVRRGPMWHGSSWLTG
jgi:hypothetical protein